MNRASKHRGFLSLAISAAVAMPLVGCDDDDEVTTDEQVTQQRQAGEQSGQQLADQLEQEIGDVATVPDDEVVGRIASVTRTINEGAIQHGQLAIDRAEDPNVLDLAQQILNDHRSALEREQQVLETLEVTPIDTTPARTLETQATDAADQLDQLDGAAFDRQFALTQVRMHAEGLVLIDTAQDWAPDNEFRAYLGDLRDTLENRLDEAITVAEQVGPY